MAVASIVVMEVITILWRVAAGRSAAEWIETTEPPLWAQVHHMFWSLPLLPLALLVRGRAASYVLWSLIAGLIGSDLAHHFIVLPLWVGNTGWHWP